MLFTEEGKEARTRKDKDEAQKNSQHLKVEGSTEEDEPGKKRTRQRRTQRAYYQRRILTLSNSIVYYLPSTILSILHV